MAVLKIGECTIKTGNFSFVSDITRNPDLASVFLNMEKEYYLNINEFMRSMRGVMEAFARAEFKSQNRFRGDVRQLQLEMRRTLGDMAKASNCKYAVFAKDNEIKLFYILQCSNCSPNVLNNFDKALSWYNKIATADKKKWSGDKREDLANLIMDLYAISSEQIHNAYEGVKTISKNVPTPERCEKYIQAFYYMILGYCKTYYPNRNYKNYEEFNFQEVPIGDYIPLMEEQARQLKLKMVPGRRYYVKEENGVIKYYLFIPREDMDEGKRREVETLHKIWADDNDMERNNIVSLRENITYSNGKVQMVFALPSVPERLSPALLESLEYSSRLKLVTDAIKGIIAMHQNEPALYHRDINPDAFMICKMKQSYKLLLDSFDCVKDTDINTSYTVYKKVEHNKDDDKKQYYIAPEIIRMKESTSEGSVWEKADIYALAKLSIYILCGGVIPEDPEKNMREVGASDNLIKLFMDMTAESSEKRPTLKEVYTTLMIM